MYIHFNNPNKPLLGEIYVSFDKSTAENSLINNRLRGALKECEVVKAIVQRLPHKKGKLIVTVEREQCPGCIRP